MRGIKIPQQYFALKRQGDLCANGGVHVFAGHYGINIMAYFYTAYMLLLLVLAGNSASFEFT